MGFENRRYVTFAVTELDQIDFDQVLETSAETVRRSVDGTQTFVKYEGDMPATVAALSTKSEPYTHDEILAILNTAEWSAPISEV
jgi:hypothetical protein